MAKERTLGQRIKEYRLERGWSQAQMAKHLKVSRPVVVKIEAGDENLMDLTRAKIAKALGIAESAVA
ncbi:MAG: hypothetical protein NVS9B14_06540 [Candidatus Acidiferrum sp.]